MYYLNNKINNEEEIFKYIENNKIPIAEILRTDSEDFLKRTKLTENVKYIIVPNLATLGNTSYKVLKYIKYALEKGCSLHIVNELLVIDNSCIEIMNFIYALLQIENEYVINRVRISKETRTKNKSKLGRKKGKKVKSKFDKYKAKIKHLYSSGYSIKKISDEIDVGTPQALGRYIKKNNLEAEKEMNNLKDILVGF